MPAVAAALTITVQLAGSALLAFGHQRWAVIGAVLLAAFTAAATLIAHAFRTFEGPARAIQANVFVEHVALVCALVFAGWWKWRAAGGKRVSDKA